ncbi:MAG: hypothetical protein NUV97_00975 [archaeon]|nr:hypothetical protein [archaeon]MCR4323467.1 hypothetical protein [Nanoarchaeota archaeon]
MVKEIRRLSDFGAYNPTRSDFSGFPTTPGWYVGVTINRDASIQGKVARGDSNFRERLFWELAEEQLQQKRRMEGVGRKPWERKIILPSTLEDQPDFYPFFLYHVFENMEGDGRGSLKDPDQVILSRAYESDREAIADMPAVWEYYLGLLSNQRRALSA